MKTNKSSTKVMSQILIVCILLQVVFFSSFFSSKAHAFSNEQEFLDWIVSTGELIYDEEGRKASFQVYKKYDSIVVYGSPFGNSSSDWKAVSGGRWTHSGQTGEFRYLGYNIDRNKVTNPYFPRDEGSTSLPPSQWNFMPVAGAADSWSGIPYDVESYMMSQSIYNMTPSQTITINGIGGRNYAKIQARPSWKSGFSVYTEYTAPDAYGKRYATFHGPTIGNANPVCSVSTPEDNYTMQSDQASISVPVTVIVNANLGGNATESHITNISAGLKGYASVSGSEVDSITYTTTANIKRQGLKEGSWNSITFNGTGDMQNIFNDRFSVSGSKTINVFVESVFAASGLEAPDIPPPPVPDDPPPTPTPPPEPPPNIPPYVKVSAPVWVYPLKQFSVGASAFDPDGDPLSYTWSHSSAIGSVHGTGGTLRYPLSSVEKTHTVGVLVSDGNGGTAYDYRQVYVRKPSPRVIVKYTGKLKENRVIQIDGSDSEGPDGFSITDYEWDVVPVEGTGATHDAVTSNIMDNDRKMNIVFAESGDYIVRLTATNDIGFSDTAEILLKIMEDRPPVADFYITPVAYRDAGNENLAAVHVQDRCYSPDMDEIKEKTLKYTYDSNNDGSFDGEAWQEIDITNNDGSLIVHLEDVGKYRFSIEINEQDITIEGFGEPYIITGKSDSKQDVCEVQNKTPIVNVALSNPVKADIFLDVSMSSNRNTAINLAESIIGGELSEAGIDYKMVTGDKYDYGFSSQVSTSSNISKQITLNNLGCIIGGSVNTGAYTYGINNNNVNVAFSGGEPQGTTQDSKQASNYRKRSSSSGFPSSIPYNSGGYSGTLYKSGNPYSASWQEWVSGSNKYATDSYEYSWWWRPNAGTSRTDPPPSSLSYNKGGYSGTLYQTSNNELRTQYFAEPDDPGYLIITYYIQHYGGTVTKPGYYETVYGYKQDYTGTVYGPVINEYQYHATFEYTKDIEYNTTNFQVREGADSYYIYITDLAPASQTKFATGIQKLGEKDMAFIVSGRGSDANTYNNYINNHGKGAYFPSDDINQSINEIKDYIINEINASSARNMEYILVGSEVEYIESYWDSENDPIYDEKWAFIHDPNYFDNPLGVIPDSGDLRDNPYTTFNLPGKYNIIKSATDNPKDDDSFSEYRKTSLPSETTLYVVRKPMAQFTCILTEAGGNKVNISYADTSYDPDHTSRTDKGIAEREWSYRTENDMWTSSKPVSLNKGEVYHIRLRVKDIDGFWSDYYVQSVDTGPANNKPVALFTIEPNPVQLAQTATVTDLSSDPDGDEITQRQWQLMNHQNTTVHDGSSPVTGFGPYGTGHYIMRLRVTDGDLWSDWYSVDVEVIDDIIPPVVSLNPEYRDYEKADVTVNITAVDDSEIRNIKHKWTDSIFKPSSGYTTESSPNTGIMNTDTAISDTGVWYLHVIATDNSWNMNETYKRGGPYKIDKKPPELNDLSILNYRHAEDDIYWYGKGDTANIQISGLEEHSGMQRTYLHITLPDDCGAYHLWGSDETHLDEYDTSQYVDVVAAQELGSNNHIFNVQFSVVCNQSALGEVVFYLRDNCGNDSGLIPSGRFIGIDTNPPQIIVSPENRPWGRENITATVSVTENESGISVIRYKWSNSHEKPEDGWYLTTDAEFYAARDQSGRWYLHIEAVDNVGNTSYGVFGSYDIDKVPPEGHHSLSTTAWTNEDVVITVTGIDEHSGMKGITMPDGSWHEGSPGQYAAACNDIYIFTLEDNVELKTEYPVAVSNIDKENPGLVSVMFSGYDRIEGNTVYVKTAEDILKVIVRATDTLSKISHTHLRFANNDDTRAFHDWNAGAWHLDEYDTSVYSSITACIETYEDETIRECEFTVQPYLDNTARVYVRLADNAGNDTHWIDTGYDVVFFSNRPPEITIKELRPDPVYEGDHVKALFQPHDPDLDTLDISVELHDSDRNPIYSDNYTLNPVNGAYPEESAVIPKTIPIGEGYVLTVSASDPHGETARDSVVFDVVKPEISGVTIEGYWNHWRGQVDLFGNQMTVEPHRFLSLECVKINVRTTGYADRVVIRFSSELEAMQFTDPYGHTYDYVDDFEGMEEYVCFPEDSTFLPDSSQKESHVYWEYLLPLAKSTVDWDDNRLYDPYVMEVYAYKGDAYTVYEIDDIDITGNVYDLVHIQPMN